MGATERIAELIKVMRKREIREMLEFAEFLLAKRDCERPEAWASVDNHAVCPL